MADERDPQVSRRYRELGAEEPPRALDDAILAASRRAVESQPAPLVAPTGRRRWYFPVAAAAVITLSVAVTLQVERQKPADELFVASAPPAQKEEAPAERKEQVKQRAFKAEASKAQAPQSSADALSDLAKSRGEGMFSRESPPSATAGVRGAPAPEPARRDAQAAETRRMEAELQVKPAPSAPARAAAPNAVLSYGRVSPDPERWLEQVAELRKQGKDEEADKLLAEFRKDYPDYPLTDEMRAKVERKK